MSFAKQRFDSCGSPQRQLCCLYVAIGMLLAYQAADWRNTGEARGDQLANDEPNNRNSEEQFPQPVVISGSGASKQKKRR